MSKVVRLTESDFLRIIKRVVNEQAPQAAPQTNDRIANIASMLASYQIRNVPTKIIINKDSYYNNKPLSKYFTDQKITQQEVNQARALLQKMGVKEGGQRPVSPNQLVQSMERNKAKKQAARPNQKPTAVPPTTGATTTAATTTPTAPTAAAAPAAV